MMIDSNGNPVRKDSSPIKTEAKTIPFNIKYRPQIESGEMKVQTRDGRPARVVCWDRKDTANPLIVLIEETPGVETPRTCCGDGSFFWSVEHKWDLFLVSTEQESEGEIMEGIIEYLRGLSVKYDSIAGKPKGVIKEWVAYLEKQKEQKPVKIDFENWDTLGYIRDIVRKHITRNEEFNELDKWLTAHYKEPKPVEWSEEDEAMRNNIIRVLSEFVITVECDSHPSLSSSYPTYLREIDWLKSLRPQKLDASNLDNFDPVDILNRIKKEWPIAWEKVVWKPSEDHKVIQIKAEIQKNLKATENDIQVRRDNGLDTDWNEGKRDGFKDAIAIINASFKWNNEEQEQPLPGTEELKEGIPGKDFIPVEWVEACEKYGIWKIVKVEQPSEELEEEIKRYLREECSSDDEPTIGEIARHFANWQKSQMLKDAVKGVVIDNGSSGTTIDTKYGVLYLPPIVYAVGDKVKIVIVKEDKK